MIERASIQLIDCRLSAFNYVLNGAPSNEYKYVFSIGQTAIIPPSTYKENGAIHAHVIGQGKDAPTSEPSVIVEAAFVATFVRDTSIDDETFLAMMKLNGMAAVVQIIRSQLFSLANTLKIPSFPMLPMLNVTKLTWVEPAETAEKTISTD